MGSWRDRLSHSKINTYVGCPLKYKFKYVDWIRRPKSHWAHAGIIFHRALEKIQLMREVGFDYPLMFEDVGGGWLGGECIAGDLIEWWQAVPEAERGGSLPVVILTSLAMLTNAIDYTPEKNEPHLAYSVTGKPEDKKIIQLYNPMTGSVYDEEVIGYLDSHGYLLEDPDRVVVIDYKTSGRRWIDGKAERDFQAMMYSYLLRKDVTFIFEIFIRPDIPDVDLNGCSDEILTAQIQHVMAKVDWPKVLEKCGRQTIRVDIGREERQRVYNWIRAFQKAQKSGAYYPTYTFGCWSRCDYAEECDQWGKHD